jgi:hypothetical protein
VNLLTVLGPGAKSPDESVERDDVAFSVSVLPWGGESTSVEFPIE